jgi:non-ribosomal peptide synthase protein (TIGR01720 family)
VGPADTYATAGRLTVTVDSELSRSVLARMPAGMRAGVDEVLLAALTVAVHRWRRDRGDRRRGLLVDLEGHGRHDHLVPGADLSRTVGWFTTLYPLYLDCAGVDPAACRAGDAGLNRLVDHVKRELRATPDGGAGYGLLRWTNPRTRDLLARPPAEIGFNYLGRFAATDADWGLDAAAAGHAGLDHDQPLPHTVDIDTAAVDEGGVTTLHTTFTYATGLLAESDVRRLAEHWRQALRTMHGHAQAPGAAALTPADVPLAALSQTELDQLHSELETFG